MGIFKLFKKDTKKYQPVEEVSETWDEGLKDDEEYYGIKKEEQKPEVNVGAPSEDKAEEKKPQEEKAAVKSKPATKAKSASASNAKASESAEDKKPNAAKEKKSSVKEEKPAATKAPAPKAKKADEKPAEEKKTEKAASPKKTASASKKSAPPKPESTENSRKPKAVAPDESDEISTSGELTEAKSTRTGRFDIKKSKDGRYVFNLYAANHMIIATSQIYSSSTSAMIGIKSVIANAPTAPIEDQTLKRVVTVTYPKWEIYEDKGGQFRFRLCASNGSCVCHSQGYTTKSSCKKGIESIIKFALDADIEKSYLRKE